MPNEIRSSAYPIVIYKLSDEDGGGHAACYPDLPGCMSDGESPEEALRNVRRAFYEWVDSYRKQGWEIPAPSNGYDFCKGWMAKA